MRMRLTPSTWNDVLDYSCGEVKVPKLASFRYAKPKPIPNGLLCEAIFGPLQSYVCSCRYLQGIANVSKTCPNCHVPCLHRKVRFERFGHIVLWTPIPNPVFAPTLAKLLRITEKQLEGICLMTHSFFVEESNEEEGICLDDGWYNLNVNEIEIPLDREREEYIRESNELTTSMAIADIVARINLRAMVDYNEAAKKLADNGFGPNALLLKNLPVYPAGYREVLEYEGRYGTAPLNVLYMSVLGRCARAKNLMEFNAPSVIIEHESTALYRAVKNLYNGIVEFRGEYLKGLYDSFKGKNGLIRGMMLGKRVDFSGRSVIVTGPDLNIDELGVPMEMGYELFRPFIIGRLRKYTNDYVTAKEIYEHREDSAFQVLEEVIQNKRVLMNRQPTLHKYGVQAFRIKLHNGKTIRVPPMVCSPFNADFDGDQVAIHLPLSKVTQNEATKLMSPTMNLINERDGEPQILPSHEMVLGIHYMTTIDRSRDQRIFVKGLRDAEHLEAVGSIKINTRIWLKETGQEARETCLGRLIIRNLFQTNQPLPAEFNKRTIQEFIGRAYNFMSFARVTESLSRLQEYSLRYATQDGISISYTDLRYDGRDEAFGKLENTVAEINQRDEPDRYEQVLRTWDSAFKSMEQDFINKNQHNPIVTMLNTGARLSRTQFRQLVVGKGLVVNAGNEIIEFPVTKSFADGMSTLEYYRTIPGARKSLMDKKNATPKAGYLTGRLMNACRDLYVREHDCRSKQGILVSRKEAEGRYLCTGEYIELGSVEDGQDDFVAIRSPVTCAAKYGICETCYGIHNGRRYDVRTGFNAGATAAHSLTEPTTQMTMRTFHTSGAVSLRDNKFAVKAHHPGVVRIVEEWTGWDVYVDGSRYLIHASAKLTVENGQTVAAGDPLALYESAEIENSDINGSLPKIEAMLECSVNSKRLKALRRTATPLAPMAGIVALRRTNKGIEVDIDGDKIATVSDLPVYVFDGYRIGLGERITYGLPHLHKSFNARGLESTFYLFKNQLRELYEEVGVRIKSVHFEVIYRCLTNTVLKPDGTRGLLAEGDEGKRILLGALQSTVQHPSWLKSMYRGWTTKNLLRAANSFATTTDLPSERIASGELVSKGFSKREA